MKTYLSALSLICIVFAMQSCVKDKCESIETIVTFEPVLLSVGDLRSAVSVEPIRKLENPGKIYLYKKYLFINDVDAGIHVVDNSNPSNPVKLAFINIPGNTEMAVRGDYLYANSYIDLVVLDISNPASATEVKRITSQFAQRTLMGISMNIEPGHVAIDYKEKERQEVRRDCNDPWVWGGPEPVFVNFGNTFDVMESSLQTTSVPDQGTGQPNRTGIGGSTARFTIVDDYLYLLDESNMKLFSLADASCPVHWTDVSISFDIETIFPYQDWLFIGAQSGMHIFDNSNPGNPVQISSYWHMTSCDPVVVEGNYAYVTLRSGTPCEGFINQLDVVDISDIQNPTLAASFEMTNPHGLGIDNGTLFICDGDDGLRVYDATDVHSISSNQLAHIKNIHTFDIIPINKRALVIGEDGFYQYDYSDPGNLQFLSKIPVN